MLEQFVTKGVIPFINDLISENFFSNFYAKDIVKTQKTYLKLLKLFQKIFLNALKDH